MPSDADFAADRSVGIMQPYFFPYWGHFSLIAATERWIVFDISQYTPKSWMNRNRILHPTKGWQYLTVPLSNSSRSIKTYEARVRDLTATRDAMIGKLDHYRKRAPFFRDTIELLSAAFDRVGDSESLVELNASTLQVVCDYIGLPFDYRICSDLDLSLPETLGPGDWAPEIAGLLGASHYVNPSSGRELFDPHSFESKGISLSFLSSGQFEYRTQGYEFEANLSILDAMMWNDPQEILQVVRDNYTLVG